MDVVFMVLGVMLFIGVLFSPLVLWDLYKKKKQKVQGGSEKQVKTIIWWQALLCGLLLVSLFIYMILKKDVGFELPALVEYIYYGLAVWSLVHISRKKIVFSQKG